MKQTFSETMLSFFRISLCHGDDDMMEMMALIKSIFPLCFSRKSSKLTKCFNNKQYFKKKKKVKKVQRSERKTGGQGGKEGRKKREDQRQQA